MQKCFKIYCLKSSEDKELIRYIGLTIKKLQTRLNEHLSESKNLKTHKDKWIQSVLKSNNKVIIELIDDESISFDELKEKEISYIKLLKSFGCKLVNGTKGGDGSIGFKHTEKTKILNGIRKSKKVFMFDYKTKNFIKEFTSITEMCNTMKFSRGLVSNVLLLRASNHKGYVFSYTKELQFGYKPKEHTVWNKGISTINKQKFKTSKVSITENDKTIYFDTVKDAAIYLNVFHSQIVKAIRKMNGVYKNYFIQYA